VVPIYRSPQIEDLFIIEWSFYRTTLSHPSCIVDDFLYCLCMYVLMSVFCNSKQFLAACFRILWFPLNILT
jgi:hypothetical protein